MIEIFRSVVITILLGLPTVLLSQNSFLEDQLRYQRVRASHEEYRELLDSLENAGVTNIYLRVFKLNLELELWVRSEMGDYKLIRTYNMCATSGTPGPKRREGDLQIPEGIYHIDRFNPFSNFYLSLGINYPNRSDRILSDPISPGSNIFIHGSCATIGCIPLGDEGIRELYMVVVFARNAGQETIPVHVLPIRMAESWELEPEIKNYREKHGEFWNDLKLIFDYFEKYNQLPDIRITEEGKYAINYEK